MSSFLVLQMLGWVGDALSLLGAYQITQRKRSGYVLFICSCLFLIPPVAYAHVWNQVGLLLAYLIIDVIGLIYWGFDE
jgi:hypothetical protein